MSFKMLKLSRLILSALILIAFLYKSVYGSIQAENDFTSNVNWKHNSKPEINLRDFINLLYEENSADTDGQNVWKNGQFRRLKRSINEMGDGSNEFQEELLNSPLSQLDLEKLEKSPWMKYMIIRNARLLYYLQEKRNREFKPRLGRTIDDCIEVQRSRPPFAPRLGKKSNFTPRLGRQLCSDYAEKQ